MCREQKDCENTKMRVSLHVVFALVLVAGWQVNECFGAASSSKSIADTDTTTSTCGWDQ